jgi:hypothetical protein
MSETTTACVRGCSLYRQHLSDCDNPDECRGCLPRRATNGLLCDPCYRRLQLMLTDAPVVYRWLTGNMSSGTGAARPHEDYERGGTPEMPAPIKVQVLDLRDLFADQLTEWVDEWCEKHGLTGPPRHSVGADSAFLLTWLPGIARLDWIGDWFETVAQTLIDAHALAPWRPAVRRIPRVPCPGCGETNLVIYGGESDITCQSCKIMMTEDRFDQWQLVLKADEAQAS